jgi:hypothetical protein
MSDEWHRNRLYGEGRVRGRAFRQRHIQRPLPLRRAVFQPLLAVRERGDRAAWRPNEPDAQQALALVFTIEPEPRVDSKRTRACPAASATAARSRRPGATRVRRSGSMSRRCSRIASRCRSPPEVRRQTGLQQTRGATLLRVPSGLVSSVSAAAGASRPFVPPAAAPRIPQGRMDQTDKEINRDWLTCR